MFTKFINDKKAVTAPLGVILMMGITLSGTLAAGIAVNQWMDATTNHANAEADHSNAEADRARFYAECARDEVTEGVEPHPKCPGEQNSDNETDGGDDQTIIKR